MLGGSASLLELDDTIVAIASAPGAGLRGIVRISGLNCEGVIRRFFASHVGSAGLPPTERVSAWPQCISGQMDLGTPLGIVPAKLLYWPTHRSYTRQPTAELHTLASPAILEKVVERACESGARPARPGEFTLRAFLAGRLDLPQAEAVLGVIDAQDQVGLQTALGQLAGNVSRPLGELRERLLDLLAHLEAGLDFVEEDIEFVSRIELVSELRAALQFIATLEERMGSRAVAAELPRVVLVGPPNAGKSSLFNALCGKEAAIVSPQAGTTRDYLVSPLVFAGRECFLFDTAGLEETGTDEIQAAAQKASRESQQGADVVLWCQDATAAAWEPSVQPASSRVLQVLTKSDASGARCPPGGWVVTSAHTGQGLDALRSAIGKKLDFALRGDILPATAARCRVSLQGAGLALRQAIAAADEGEELIAGELRLAIDELGQILGAVYTDDVLDRIFGRFCIGK